MQSEQDLAWPHIEHGILLLNPIGHLIGTFIYFKPHILEGLMESNSGLTYNFPNGQALFYPMTLTVQDALFDLYDICPFSLHIASAICSVRQVDVVGSLRCPQWLTPRGPELGPIGALLGRLGLSSSLVSGNRGGRGQSSHLDTRGEGLVSPRGQEVTRVVSPTGRPQCPLPPSGQL